MGVVDRLGARALPRQVAVDRQGRPEQLQRLVDEMRAQVVPRRAADFRAAAQPDVPAGGT
jgi:hypothetical protein